MKIYKLWHIYICVKHYHQTCFKLHYFLCISKLLEVFCSCCWNAHPGMFSRRLLLYDEHLRLVLLLAFPGVIHLSVVIWGLNCTEWSKMVLFTCLGSWPVGRLLAGHPLSSSTYGLFIEPAQACSHLGLRLIATAWSG